MKMEELQKNIVYRNIAGEHILVPIGKSALEISGLFLLNNPGIEIWEMLCAGNSKEEIITKLLDEYDVERSVLENDVEGFMSSFIHLCKIEV